MQLVIAEKPSVAQSLSRILGVTTRKDGYLEGKKYIVSWCFGHLAGLADADVYDTRYCKKCADQRNRSSKAAWARRRRGSM